LTGKGSTLLCLLAGGGDTATGFLLIAMPALVLRLLGLAPEADLRYLRFAGVFVGCVGLALLYPWLWRDRRLRDRRLASALEMTAGVRLAVALFLGVAVAAGEMDMPWLKVGVYDALVAWAQLAVLFREGFGDAR